jgi:hypothetical protein
MFGDCERSRAEKLCCKIYIRAKTRRELEINNKRKKYGSSPSQSLVGKIFELAFNNSVLFEAVLTGKYLCAQQITLYISLEGPGALFAHFIS